MTMRVPALLAALGILAVSAANAAAQAPCYELCRIPCVKPISLADRWDDATGIPGYMGEDVSGRVQRPDWRNNAHYDFESFTDGNANGLHDPEESYVDGNGNGTFDAEAYDEWTTGYRATVDQGLEITLHAGSPTDAPTPGLFFAVGLPPVNKGTPLLDGESYAAAWTGCASVLVQPGDRLQLTASALLGPTNQAMQSRIAADPDATWDDATQSVINSAFGLSPRVWFIPVHDPRIPYVGGAPQLVVRKVVAFFAEAMTGPAECRGRLLRVGAEGEGCGGGSAGGFIVGCAVPAAPSTWGRVKATFR